MHSPIATYLTETLESVASDTSGELANYIPELAAVDPDKLAASIAMVDGEQYAAGDSDVEFTIQSISKPFVYALALADRGYDDVLAKVGVEPSGGPSRCDSGRAHGARHFWSVCVCGPSPVGE